ncbi:MAG TPA: PadR family transcriptional regulator [Pseudonocardiaceae bacterium]|jgi:DNA-binding PadR family transcriptional regulator|nr:PadR family transcriptional regulator [Pseudonocardiaceae bacterium]
MSATRLLVLGVVRGYGQAHGYQVRRELLSWGADHWANVAPGSIYHALKKLAKDGLLAEVASEEGDAGPDRLVYALTHDGETEFVQLLTKALSSTDPGNESIFAATTFLTTLTRAHVIGLLGYRLSQVRASLDDARRSVAGNADMGKPAHVRELFRHWEYAAEAEARWAEQLIERLEAGEYVMADDSPDHFGHPGAADQPPPLK